MSVEREQVAGHEIIVAYADPPYLGCCKLYDHHHPDGHCWDDLETHRLLIERLVTDFPDGWALSLTSSSLQRILPLCPEDVRVAAWAKTFGAFKKGVRPAYMWEPVIFRGGRNPSSGWPHLPPEKGGKQNTPKDFHVEHCADMLLSPITLKRGLTGAKPEAFCFWVFELLNVRVGDTLMDLFIGSGAVSDAWERWRRLGRDQQPSMPPARARQRDGAAAEEAPEPGRLEGRATRERISDGTRTAEHRDPHADVLLGDLRDRRDHRLVGQGADGLCEIEGADTDSTPLLSEAQTCGVELDGTGAGPRPLTTITPTRA